MTLTGITELRFFPALLRLTVSLLLIGWIFAGVVNADDEATRDRRHRQLLEKRDAILDGLRGDLESVETWCNEHNQSEAIPTLKQIELQLLSPDTEAEPPRAVTPEVDKTLAMEEQQWRLQVQHHRKTRSIEMYSLARSALRAGFLSMAFSIVRDVIRIDSDHKDARSILGKQIYRDPLKKDDALYSGEWVSAFEKKMRSSGKVYRHEYGWLPTANVARYEQNLRPWKGDWISVEKEAEQRRDFRNAWEVPSEHFLVKTNVSLEAGVQLSEQLELFHSWLQQNFAAFFETPQALQDRFEKAGQRSSSRKDKPMEVHYYATREEYQRRVEGKVPANIETNGLYWRNDRTSYFFQNREKRDFSTLFHEATHQILDVDTIEDRRIAARTRAVKLKQRNVEEWPLCESSNFWIIEGLACYFESFEVVDGEVAVGRPDYPRFDKARQRVVDPSIYFYTPSSKFLTLGRAEFLENPDLAGPRYSQAAGFVHFLMHYDDGLYRDDLITLLTALYRPSGDSLLREPSLTRIAGVSYDDLDHQYRTHMQNLTDKLKASGAIEEVSQP